MDAVFHIRTFRDGTHPIKQKFMEAQGQVALSLISTESKPLSNSYSNVTCIVMSKKTKSVKQVAEEFASKLRKNATPYERQFRKLLESCQIRFKTQKIVYKTKSFYIVDFYLPTRMLCIELDGKHHLLKDNLEKDKSRDKFLKQCGFKVWRMQNTEAQELTKESMLSALAQFPEINERKIILPCNGEKNRNIYFRKSVRKPKNNKKVKASPIKKDFPVIDAILAKKIARDNVRNSVRE